MIAPRSNATALGYRISVQDRGKCFQLRWLITIRRNGSLLYQTSCLNNDESYGRAIIRCFSRAETCQRLGMYCKTQVDRELARQDYAASRELADKKLTAG